MRDGVESSAESVPGFPEIGIEMVDVKDVITFLETEDVHVVCDGQFIQSLCNGFPAHVVDDALTVKGVVCMCVIIGSEHDASSGYSY